MHPAEKQSELRIRAVIELGYHFLELVTLDTVSHAYIEVSRNL